MITFFYNKSVGKFGVDSDCMMMPDTSLHLSLHDINLSYLDSSLQVSLSKYGKEKTHVTWAKKSFGNCKKSLVRVLGDLHPRDHRLSFAK